MDFRRIAQQYIFPGESGGDYGALYGYANRPGGAFEGVNLTDMTVDQAIQFSDPSGPYAQHVKGQVGRVATPMGAYQVVGTTLRDAKRGLGLRGDEPFNQQTQDRIGQWIYENQGPSAWEAWGKGGNMNARMSAKQMPPGLLDDEQPQGNQRFANVMDALAIGLQGMTHQPNQALMQMSANRMQQRRKDARDTQQRNRTAGWLQKMGAGQLAEGVASGALGARDAFNLYRTQVASANDPNVQSSQMLPDQSGTVMTMRDGTLKVVTVGGETLSGDAAREYVQKAQDAYTKQQREINAAREGGKLESQIELGGEAERTKAEGRQAPAVAREYLQQAEMVGSTIRNMGSAIKAIDDGAESGIVYNMLPNVTRASAELQNAKNKLGLDVIGSVTFGALSEQEMKVAMDTAVPQDLGPRELRKWLVEKREAQQKMHAALVEAAAHFASGGSMEAYVEKYKDNTSSKPSPSGTDAMSDDQLLDYYGAN